MVASQSILRQSFVASQQEDADHVQPQTTTTSVPLKHSPTRNMFDSPEKTFQTAKEDQTTRVVPDAATATSDPLPSDTVSNDDAREEDEARAPTSPTSPTSPPSEGSSPIRPVVRKSSLNFASLPAREPLTAGKNAGARVSRTSHLDHNRTSHFGRPTGGKSLGNHAWRETDEEEGDDDDQDQMDIDQRPNVDEKPDTVLNHNKTYTQRLQDQINRLGKSSSNGSRPSKSIPNLAALQQIAVASQPPEALRSPSPKHVSPTKSTPGAFPEDDDDWIEPPAPVTEKEQSLRPILPKSHSADVMEGIHREQAGTTEFLPSTAQTSQSVSPIRPPISHGHALGHAKAASVSTIALASQRLEDQTLPLAKANTVSDPTMRTIAEIGQSQTPSKSPSRGFRESPLKQVKNKVSSILKSSRTLWANSAVISAEAKAAILPPSPSRLALHTGPSTETLNTKPSHDSQFLDKDATVTLPVAKRTRASVEREKEEKRREKEAKRMEEQMDKLEKAREKEREKARVFSKEQEKMSMVGKQISSKNTEAKLPVKETPKPVRTSPRKQHKDYDETAFKSQTNEDVEMTEAPVSMPPPSIPRSAGPAQAARGKEVKRPMKPTKDTQAKAKQAPTVIRVNTGSQHSQYHVPTGAASASATVPETPVNSGSQHQAAASKASKASLQKKPSTQSLKGSATVGRPKALDLAAKKKEQDEKEAQRRREAKAEMDRKRAAAQEEQRRQDQQRLEAERQKQKEREQAAAAAQAETKQNAQRQAMIEKAKQTRAPPPAVRSQPNGPPDFSSLPHEKPMPSQNRPPSRMGSGLYRSHEESGRPVNAVLSNASKAGMKRTLGVDPSNDTQGQRPPSRAGPSYQTTKDAKRRRTSQEHDELNGDNPPNIKGPPVRPSSGLKKVRTFENICGGGTRTPLAVVNNAEADSLQELSKKPLYTSNGYTNAQPNPTRDLFKATLTGQLNSHSKAAHPLDMAQISKGAIPFAPNPNPAGTHGGQPVRATPASSAKAAARAAPKSSPRYQNGDAIELPEIQTDDEDEDEDDAGGMVAPWADSPDLRRALMRQETMDPSQIFGPPAALNMEEVFSKSKERFHKFRARTSSANWSGTDRLTEEDIRKDLAARDKLRREGAWSYELSRDMQ